MENNEKIYVARRVIRIIDDGDKPGMPFINWFVIFLLLSLVVGAFMELVK